VKAADEADVTLTSAVHAEEICFQEVPDTQVDFTGHTDHRSTSGSARSRLPDRVRQGVAYRDIRVDYWIVARLSTDSGES
jgi:hypothetical protein